MPDPALQGLYGLRAAAFGWPEVIAALILGLFLAAMVGLALRLFRRRRPSALSQRITAARNLPEGTRSIVLAGLLQQQTNRLVPGDAPWPDRAVERFGLDVAAARQLHNLYQPDAAVNAQALERALLKAGSG
ncbi:MAG: hypothetical protein AAF557_08340 [Pseudomonadota bacterium]